MNPIMGQALEAAREAEAERLASQEPGTQNDSEGDEEAPGGQSAQGPIHHVEIEAAELVPSHSGRGQRGFVARVHREVAGQGGAGSRFAESPSRAPAGKAQTHVFADHHDLVSFLRDEFAKDCAGK